MRKVLSILVSALVTVALLVFLLHKVSFIDIATTLGNVPLGYLFLGFALYVLVQVFRSVRSWFLLRGMVRVRTLFGITCVHNALINVLPARTGELSYVYLLKKRGVNVGTGMGTLALARISDLLAISVLFFGAGLLVSDLPDIVLRVRTPALLLLGTIILALVLLLLFSRHAVMLLQRLARTVGLGDRKAVNWVIAKVEEMFHSFHVMKSWRPAGGAVLCSLAIWTLLFAVNYVIFAGIGVTSSFVLVVLASSVFSLLSSIPVHGIAGLGTIEAFWTVSLIAIGVPAPVAIVAAFAQHVIALLYILLLGVYGVFARSQ